METTIERNHINIEDEMRRSYLDYAMSVIIGRALPDVRDGLKPVHRRVLWAMNELGNQYNKAYKKSARVVGDCFVKGALVHTETGLAPIEKLEIGNYAQMPNGYLSRIIEAFHNPPSPVINVNLSNGSTMTVTPGQLFRVLRDDLSVGWERADNLAGKKVLVSNPRCLGLPESHPCGETIAAAYIAGLLVAEGYLTDRGRSSRVGINMTDKEPLEFLSAYCEQQGIAAHWGQVPPQELHHKPQHRVRFSGWKEAYVACADTSAHKQVPDWILSDRRLFAPFLAGFTDGDGHVRTQGSRREAVLTSTSGLLLTQIQAMLADGGIHCRYTCEDFSNRAYGNGCLPRYNLWITGDNASRFCNLIGDYLKVGRKRDCAVSIANWSRQQQVANTASECIPGRAVFAELSKHHLGAGWYRDGVGNKFRAGIKYPDGSKIRYASDLLEKEISYRQIEIWGISSKLERIGSPLAERLKTLMETYCILDVESIVDRGELAETYDVQIEDAGHEFMVQGCAVHNCIGKYHPHGDTAVYDTIVRMAQDFSMRYPLIDGQGNFGCFTGDTKVKLLDGTEKSFADLAKLSADEVFYVYSVDKSGRIVIGEGRNARITRRDAHLIELTLDSGARIRCTPDHGFMLRDGTYKAAKDLTVEDSLMPGYFDAVPIKEGLNEYLRVLQPATGEYEFVHHLADEFNEQKGLAQRFNGAFVRHHKNFNRRDNLPIDASQNYNHRVVSKRWLDERADVYDITVDRYHNFLLADGVFVHNSVDGDAAAAMRYCVTGETLVVTHKGLIPIAQMSRGTEDIHAQVLSHGHIVNTASKWFDSGEHPVYRVRTRHGYEITGTSNHPLLVCCADNQGRPSFVWKTIKQLQRGDVLVVDRSERLWPKRLAALRLYYPVIPASSRTERHTLPKVLDQDLAFLLGALTAEGTVQCNRIEFTNTPGDYADEFVRAWKRVFPTCRLHTWMRPPTSYGKRPFWQMQVVSQQVVAFLHNLGLGGKSGTRLVPEVVLRSPQAVVAAFLRGLFEGDGSVERSGRSLLRITLTSCSEKMLKQVQTLLLRFGIVCARFSDATHGRQTFRLCITGSENLQQFAERIGFFSEAKKHALVEVLEIHSGRVLAKNDFIPLHAAYVRRHAVRQRCWLERHNFDRPQRLNAALPRLALALRSPDFRLIEFLARTDYLYDPIVAIEEVGTQSVYSLRVDSDCHSFVANGFINHNTEVRMARLASEVLADIEKETVDFNPNYDESLSEPSVLPTRIPNLLVNGSDGIAVGMATKIPPHNLTEIIDATIALLRKPAIKIEELAKIVTGPDFPTGGFIYGRGEIRKSYLEGRGVLQLRARAGIDRIGRGSSERDAIVITEIPFQVNKARLIERIAELVNEKKLEGIADLRDESDRDGMRIVIELKRDAVPQVILNKLYKLTPMQSSFGVINLAIVNGQPRVLNLKQMLEAFVDFRREVVRRRTEYELRKAKARAHILEGLTKAIDALDHIVTLIRNARSVEEARQWLTGDLQTMSEVKSWKGVPGDLTLAGYLSKLQKAIKRLGFSEAQAQAILDLQLRRLSALERQKIIDEYEGIIRLIAELEEILANENSLRRVIIKELEDVKKDFGDKRRTEIVDEGVELSIEDLIADEDVAITVTNSGYIKRTPITTYHRQGRGGKGRFGASAKNGDFVEHLFIASTHAYLMVFTDDGQVYKLKVHEVPDAAASARGKAIVNLINIPSARKLAGVVPVREFSEGRYVVMVTRKGVIKKTSLAEFQNIRSNGINAINVDEGDELLDVVLTDGTKRIFIATHNGLAIRFDEEDVRPMGRAARGVRGIDLRKDDYVVALCAVSADDSERMLSVSEQGFGKQTPISSYRFQSRGGKGVINMKTTEKTGKLVAVFPVDDESEVMIITQQGKLIRIEAGDIRKTGRSASGVRLIKTDGDDKVTSASLIDPSSDESAVEEAAAN